MSFMKKMKGLGYRIKNDVIDPTLITKPYEEKMWKRIRKKVYGDFDETDERDLENTVEEVQVVQRETEKLHAAKDNKEPTKSQDKSESSTKIPQLKKQNEPVIEVSDENKPTLDTLLRFYDDAGVVGERKTSILQTLATINKVSYGVEGPSGSGKSFVVNPLMDLMGDTVYRMELSSKTAEMYNAEEINKHGIIYIPELQKALQRGNSLVVEMVKNLTEGRDARRRVRDQGNDKNILYEITTGKQIVYTLALENEFKKDKELARRFLQLYTDTSKDHMEEVISLKAEKRFMTQKEKKKITAKEKQYLKSHLKHCFEDESNFINPFAEYLSKSIPRETKALSFDDYYYDLMEASALFHKHERVHDSENVFVNVQDAYMVHEMYGQQMNLSVMRIPMLGDKVLKMFDEEEHLDNSTVYDSLRNTNTGITKTQIKQSLDELVDLGFLESKGKEYKRGSRFEDFDNKVDWENCFYDAAEKMTEKFPEIAESWFQSQVNEGAVDLYNPVTETREVLGYVE